MRFARLLLTIISFIFVGTSFAWPFKSNPHYTIGTYMPTYMLPFYYTEMPDQAVGRTPDNQKIMSAEFKAQLSFQMMLWYHPFQLPVNLKAAYTQLSYWQFYAKSQFFRETNYMPQIFLTMDKQNTWGDWHDELGLVHQSNGRGGSTERSWNRVYAQVQLTHSHWMVAVKPWLLIFKEESSDLHNRHITRYLGYGHILLGTKFYHQTLVLMLRNNLESGFSHGAEQLNWSFPLFGKLSGFVQAFSGYGQSLIEYNHYTNSIGIGVAINNWF